MEKKTPTSTAAAMIGVTPRTRKLLETPSRNSTQAAIVSTSSGHRTEMRVERFMREIQSHIRKNLKSVISNLKSDISNLRFQISVHYIIPPVPAAPLHH